MSVIAFIVSFLAYLAQNMVQTTRIRLFHLPLPIMERVFISLKRATSFASLAALSANVLLGTTLGVFAPLAVPTVEAASTIWSDDFGLNTTIPDIPNWDEEGNEGDATTQIQQPGGSGSEDSPSPNAGALVRVGPGEWMCRSVNAAGLDTLKINYYWRDDNSAEDGEAGIVEYYTGGTCDAPTGLSTLATHELDDTDNGGTSAWSALQTVNLPGSLSNSSFFVRFRNTANSSDEILRIDGVSVTGETIVVAVDPKLTVTATVNGGPKTIADVSLTVDAGAVVSGAQNTYTAGAHTVAGNTLASYTKTISGHCAANGSITLATNDVKSCSVTYDYVAPPAVTFLGFRNQTSGSYDSGPAIQPCGSTNTTGFAAFEWAESGVSPNQPLSYEYKILSGPAGVGYTEVHTNTHHNGGIPAAGTYTVQITPTDSLGNVGTPVSCVMTYAPMVTVTIAKYINGVHATVPNANSSSFNMTAVYNATNIGAGSSPYTIGQTGNNTPTSYEAKTIPLAYGADYSTYEDTSVSCTAAYPFALVGYTTGDTEALAAAAVPSMTIPAFTGMTTNKFVIVWNKTCPPAPTHLSPADGVTLTPAQLDKIDWSDITTDPAMPITYYYQSATNPATNPDGSFTSPAYTSGPLSMSEIPALGTPVGTYYWHVRAVDGAGNSSVWSTPWTIIVAPAPKLTVNIVMVNDNGGTKTSADVSVTVDGGAVTSGVQATYTVGTHTVAGTSLTGYTQTINADCAADGTISLTFSDVKTCTVTYDDIAPKLTVIKHVVNDNSGTLLDVDVPLFVDGNSVITNVQNTFDAGLHLVTETNAAGYDFMFTGDCSATGSILLNPGDVKVCIITNDDQPAELTVIKEVINDNGGALVSADFTMHVTGNAPSLTTFSGDALGTVVVLNAGSYTASETSVSGYTGTLSADCSGIMLPGDHKICTITNDDEAGTLTVIKNVINNDGRSAVASAFTINVNGTNVSLSTFAAADGSGTTVTLDAGAFDVVENATADYTTTYSADCSGTILNGQSLTCTVTNDDLPVLPTGATEANEEGFDDGNSSRRGSETNRLGSVMGVMSASRGLGGPVAPAAFGGSADTPLSDEEKAFLCGIQRSLPRTVTYGLIDWIADQLADTMNRPADLIASVLKQPLCEKEVETKALVAAATQVPLDEKGYPVSENDLWNKCIRNERIYLEEVRNNLEEWTPLDEHRRVLPRSCASYHTGNNWFMPGLDIYFTWNPTKKVATFPKGYVGVKNVSVVEGQSN